MVPKWWVAMSSSSQEENPLLPDRRDTFPKSGKMGRWKGER